MSDYACQPPNDHEHSLPFFIFNVWTFVHLCGFLDLFEVLVPVTPALILGVASF